MLGSVNAQNFGVGVPAKFTKQTSSSRTIRIQKGQLNHVRMRPRIVNEHVETARHVQSVVTAANTVGQIFKASQDNINGITLTMESAGGSVFDDFESYADDGELQAAWITALGEPALLETVIVHSGLQSMALDMSSVVGSEWGKSFASTDFTNYTGEFEMYSENSYLQSGLSVFVEDNTGNTSSTELISQEAEIWEHFYIDVNLLEADGATPADLTDIVKIGFRLDDRHPGGNVYIDEMISVPPPGSVDIELWDMGPSLPESGVFALDDGTQYVELGDRGSNGGTVSDRVRLELVGGLRNYTVERFIAGVAEEIPSNTKLYENRYYAIVLRHVDTDVSIYGANTSFEKKYYHNGYAFTSSADSSPIEQVGEYNDLQFAVFSTQDVYVNTFLKFYDAIPGANCTESIYIEDCEMKIVNIVAGENKPQQNILAEFKDRTFYFPKGGKFEVNMNDDYTDDTKQVTVLLGYIYEPAEAHG